ncbi:hypothetical protein LTR94_031292, partial [Friedmanniomyces endolithicus]
HRDPDPARRRQRLCAVVLASARRECAVRRAAGRRLHSGAGHDLSAGMDDGACRRVRFAAGDRGGARHLRHAAHDPPVPQLLCLGAARAVPGRAHRRRRLLAHLYPGDAADVVADHRRGRDHAGHRRLERLYPGPGVRRSREPADDGPAEQRDQHHHRHPPVQRQHGGDHPDGRGAAGDLLHLRTLVRARHRRRRRERI